MKTVENWIALFHEARNVPVTLKLENWSKIKQSQIPFALPSEFYRFNYMDL